MYYWEAWSDDQAFYDESKGDFETEKEAYNNMRDAVLQKMKWNTEYSEDYYDMEDGDYILYEVQFAKNKIIHKSYSGTYTYVIKKRKPRITQFSIDVLDKDVDTDRIEKILKGHGIEVVGISNDNGWDWDEYF